MRKFTKTHRQNLSKAALIAQNRPKQRAMLSRTQKGSNNSNWGKKWPKERVRQARVHMKKYPLKHWLGKKQPKEMVEKRRAKMLGHKHSKKSIEKMSRARRGKDRWNWKGGITPLTKQIRFSPQYKQWRSDVFQRDNWTCLTCNEREGNLVAHHIKKFYKILQENKIKTLKQALSCKELWDVNNGVTLCLICHKLTKKGKKYA